MNKGVSVAEKRAMLEAAGEPWPVCDCHGEPKVWCKEVRSKEGGFWFCREKRREINRRYNQSEKGHEAKRRYDRSEKGREMKRRREQSEKGREARRRSNQRRVKLFGERFVAPDQAFREYAIQLREERKAQLKEAAANGGA